MTLRPTTRPAVGDLVAGITVALVLIPQALAYAELAGLPPQHGLYAAAIPLLVAAPLASSPYLQTGPVALTAVLTFGALSAVAEPRSEHYVELALLLALVVGVVRLAIGLGRAGVVAYLLSRPMLIGFIPAAAVFIVLTQLPAAFGAAAPAGSVLEQAAWTVAHPGAWSATALLIAALAAGATLAGRRVHPLVPGVLLAVVAATVWSNATGYAGERVGDIDVGMPPISLGLPWGDVLGLLIPGAIIAFVGFAEPAAIARSFAAQDRLAWDANREFVSQGAANVASGLSGGFPIGGSFSRSALNRAAGARSAWSGAVTGIVVLAMLPVVFLLADLPSAVLAAIVITAVAPLIRLRPILRVWRRSRPAASIAVGTFVATLAFAPRIERGVLVGVGLSVAVHLWRELRVEAESWVRDGVLHLRPHGVLWFGAVQVLEDVLVAELVRHPDVGAMCLHLDSIGRLDITAALTLQSVIEEAEQAGVRVELADVQERDRRLVDGVVLERPEG
jgi:SulP family sulfate permease